jgi:hypothetical protein
MEESYEENHHTHPEAESKPKQKAECRIRWEMPIEGLAE